MEYRYSDGSPSHAHAWLLPICDRLVDRYFSDTKRPRHMFDLGCGNGSVAMRYAARGFLVTGVDASESGIVHAPDHPSIRLETGSAYDDLASRYEHFPVVISLEVVEHLYDPRAFARTLFSLVEPGGIAIISTPYHGYLKNLALALTGRMDWHFTALWDHGHIKFWSPRTLSTLLREAGFGEMRVFRLGRIPPLAKSMVVEARKP